VTKVAIVFLVVLSLLMTAGVVVFVNRIENFKTTNAALSARLAIAQAKENSAADEIKAQKQYADEARKQRDQAYTDGASQVADRDKKIADQNIQIAQLESDKNIAELARVNTSNALLASETARGAQAKILDDTRKESTELLGRYSDSQRAISDLTNKLEVATRLLTNSTETIAENKAKIERDEQIINDAHIANSDGKETGLDGGAPPINAVVRSMRMINGIPYATISVGADAQVKKGMKFNVVDRDKGAFLGELTIGQVDEKEATGKLEGPKIDEVRAGTEVRTQI
jgi:hypothetical protein